MVVELQQIISLINRLAPEKIAFEWDNVGLQVGEYDQEIKRALLTLDVSEEVLNEAIEKDCQLIISHHPLIFNKIGSIDNQSSTGRIIIRAIRNNIAIYSAHTNLDIARGGLNDYLAEELNLGAVRNLKVVGEEKYYKLVVFVPEDYIDQVEQSVLEAGAGQIGNYNYSSFATGGKGTFRPLDGSKPFIGNKGEVARINEVRFETILPAELKGKIVQVMLDNHPYEEVAFDLYPLANNMQSYGLGRIGSLKKSVKLEQYLEFIKERLGLPVIKYSGEKKKLVKKVAICSGSGAELIENARKAGADLYLTGDIKYHEAQLAEELDLALVDAGHYETEILTKGLLKRYLQGKSADLDFDIEFIESHVNTNPWKLEVGS